MPTDDKNDPSYCLDLSDNQIKLHETHRYADQVQFNPSVCEKDYCDFLAWTTKGMTE